MRLKTEKIYSSYKSSTIEVKSSRWYSPRTSSLGRHLRTRLNTNNPTCEYEIIGTTCSFLLKTNLAQMTSPSAQCLRKFPGKPFLSHPHQPPLWVQEFPLPQQKIDSERENVCLNQVQMALGPLPLSNYSNLVTTAPMGLPT